MSLPDVINLAVTEAKAKVASLYDLKGTILAKSAELNELSVSFDSLVRLLGHHVDMGPIRVLIEDKKLALSSKVDEYERHIVDMRTQRQNCRSLLKSLNDLYHALDVRECVIIDGATGASESDPFVVEMNKLMYPIADDNRQLRSDPPIAGVSKNSLQIFCPFQDSAMPPASNFESPPPSAVVD